MDEFIKLLSSHWLSSVMAVFACILFVQVAIYMGVRFVKSWRLKKIKKKKKVMRLMSLKPAICTVGAGVLLLALAYIKAKYFQRFDDMSGGMWAVMIGIAVCIFANILVFLLKDRGRVATNSKMWFFYRIDDMLMSFSFVLVAALVAAEIPDAEITRTFGAGVSRFAIVNLPFILALLYVATSNLLFWIDVVLKKWGKFEMPEFIVPIVFVGLSFFACRHFSLSLVIALILSIGVACSWLFRAAPKLVSLLAPTRKHFGVMFGFSRMFGALGLDMLVLLAVISTVLWLGGVYGLTLLAIGLASGAFMSMNEPMERRDAFRHISQMVAGVALVYLFWHTICHILNKNISVNIFSREVVPGVLAAMAVLFMNVRHIIKSLRSLLIDGKRREAAFSTVIYVALWAALAYIEWGFITYAFLSAFVLTLALFAPIVSLVILRVCELGVKRGGWQDMLIILNAQVSTFIIVMVILLLPLVGK
ncbi:MAG: hypothetical protein FWD15_03135 [Alphaproteobacteria bacterium]|nr:hypothetical protein [Alphaproteobacteria bacterium]